MTTDVDLSIGVNLEIGSVPVSLAATVVSEGTETVYSFSGCVQDAVIDLGAFISTVGQQFGVAVELPPELNLEAIVDYVAGQIIYTTRASGDAVTEVCMAAKFDLEYSNGSTPDTVTLNFYADTQIASPAPDSGNPYVVGSAIDTNLLFADLPLVGDIPVFKEYSLKHIGFSYTNADPDKTGKEVKFSIPQVETNANPLYTRSPQDAKNAKSYSISTKGDQTTFALTETGFSLTAGLIKQGSTQAEGNFALPMSLPAKEPTDTPATYYKDPDPASQVQTSPPASPIHWVDVNKTFGPLDVQRIGLNYSKGEATFGINAGLTMTGFTLDVQGLSITFPLPLPGMPAGKEVSFDIDGLAMDYDEGGLQIGGAFLKAVENDITNYFGEIVVQVSQFGFKAIGGYAPAQQGNPAAFFLYANIEEPLGGPPCLYVTGLAFGFGLNYALVLPTLETLPTYLLLPGQAPPQGSAKDALTTVIGKLENGSVINYEPGEYWVGFGIQFTSFDLVNAFAMVTVSFGVEAQVAIIGSCSIVLPEGDPAPLGNMQVNLVASFTPSTGLLSVLGVATPESYVLGPFVKVTGGFAYNLWFSGEHKGDFVVSLGGYHPAFVKPAYYPAVPRIRLTFHLDSLQTQGQAYLALTPSMFMAGVQVNATFDASGVKAWFDFGVDFVVAWAPFQYLGDAYVNVGCSVNVGLLTVKVHIGADLTVWGPAFGGKALVDLDIISFTIQFGSDAPTVAPVTWRNIEQQFLPRPTSAKPPTPAPMRAMAMPAAADSAPLADEESEGNVSASVSAGLVDKDQTSEDGEVWDWILDPDHFQLVTTTSIPANDWEWVNGASSTASIPNDSTQFDLSDVDVSQRPYLALDPGAVIYSNAVDDPPSATLVWNPTIDIKPMKLRDVKSVHTITLAMRTTSDGIGQFSDYLLAVTAAPVLGSSNTALWGNPDNDPNDPNAPLLLPATLLGVEIRPVPRDPDTVNNVPLIDLLFTQGEQTTFSYTSSQPDPRFGVTACVQPSDAALEIAVTGAATENFTDHNYVLSTLTDSWVETQRQGILDDLDANGFGTYGASEVTLTEMGSTEELTDWPTVALLGALSPTTMCAEPE